MALKPLHSLNLLLLLLALFSSIAVSKTTATTPSPPAATDCSTVILTLTDCLTYVSNGSTLKKPQGTCCSGLKTVLKTNAQCLCEEFKNSGQLGIPIDLNRALTMPTVCHIPAPAGGLCGISLSSPVSSPAPSPTSSVLPSATVVPPAPAPNKASSALGVSVGSFIAALVTAAFSIL